MVSLILKDARNCCIGDVGMIKLSSQQYAGVVTSLQSAAVSSGSDKRQFSRIEIQAPVKLAVLADNKVTRCFTALSRDVSQTGIGLYQAAKFAPKEIFLLSLPCAKKQLVIVCLATFCRPLADGIYCVGAQFESEATPAMAGEFRAVAGAAITAAA
jgi:PilZ domain